MTRIERIKLLLLTQYDYLPQPHSSSLSSESGFVNYSRQYDCPDCSLNGFVSSACSTCQGSGRVPGPHRDPYDTGSGVAFMGKEEERRRDDTRKRDARLERVDRPLVPSEDTYSWERRKAHYERHGSYAELRHALERMRDHNLASYAIIHSRYLNNVQVKTYSSGLENLALELLSSYMPKKIKVPPWVMQEPKSKNESLLALAEAGVSSKKIALQLRMSQRAVKKILRQKKRESRDAPSQ